MTKLRRKLKQMAKKRAHTRTVFKRKVERAAREAEEKKARDEEKLAEEVEREMARLNEAAEQSSSGIGATGLSSNAHKVGKDPSSQTPSETKQVGPAIQKGAKKQLTRKQAKRKEKLTEKGEAITQQLEKKWGLKKIRVKQRAQVRNENLHN